VKRLITKKKNSEYKSSSTTPEEKHLLKPTAGDIVHALGNMINKRSLHEQEGYPIRPAEGYPRWKAASEAVQRGVVTFSSNARLEKPYPVEQVWPKPKTSKIGTSSEAASTPSRYPRRGR
jgi:hypothetical protein